MKSRKKGPGLKTVHILSKSPEETERVGAELARSLPVPGVVLLRGALGAGKTTLTRGIARGLGIRDPRSVNSPSFTLVNVYHGICPIYHVDLYRLQGERDLYSIGLDDFLGHDGVTVIEWSERLNLIFEKSTEVEFEDAGDDMRILHIISPGFRKRHSPKPGAGRRKQKPAG